MKVLKVGDAEKNRKELEIQIDRAEFDAAVDAAFKKNAPKKKAEYGFEKSCLHFVVCLLTLFK